MSCSSVASSVTENEGTEECIGSGYGEGTWTGTGGAGLGGGAYECTESPRRTSSSSAKRTARFPLQIVKWKKIRRGASNLENRRRKGELMQGSRERGGACLVLSSSSLSEFFMDSDSSGSATRLMPSAS